MVANNSKAEFKQRFDVLYDTTMKNLPRHSKRLLRLITADSFKSKSLMNKAEMNQQTKLFVLKQATQARLDLKTISNENFCKFLTECLKDLALRSSTLGTLI